MNLPPSLVEKLDGLPPWMCRMMAKADGRLMTNAQLCKATGWGERKLNRIAWAKTFARVSAGDIDIFLSACGMRWSSQRRERWLIKKAGNNFFNMQHLRCDKTNGPQVSQVMRHARRMFKIIGQGS